MLLDTFKGIAYDGENLHASLPHLPERVRLARQERPLVKSEQSKPRVQPAAFFIR
jgi:hypothetical protein